MMRRHEIPEEQGCASSFGKALRTITDAALSPTMYPPDMDIDSSRRPMLLCPSCGMAMSLADITAPTGAAAELHAYECRHCCVGLMQSRPAMRTSVAVAASRDSR
jgi:hypothetical protein